MGITAIMAAAALTMGSLTYSGGVGAFAATPAVSPSSAATHLTPAGKHGSDGCGRKKGKHAPSTGGAYVWGAPGQTLSPTDGGYVSAPAGQAVSPIVGGYASVPAGQTLSPVGGGYALTPSGEAIAPVG